MLARAPSSMCYLQALIYVIVANLALHAGRGNVIGAAGSMFQSLTVDGKQENM